MIPPFVGAGRGMDKDRYSRDGLERSYIALPIVLSADECASRDAASRPLGLLTSSLLTPTR